MLERWRRTIGANPALADPDLRRLSVSAACYSFAMGGEQVVLGLLAYRMTDSSVWVGVALALYFAPNFFIGALAGMVADRFDRRRLLLLIELSLLLVLGITGVALLGGVHSVALVLCAATASGSVRALAQPVRSGYAYDLAGGASVVSALGVLNVGTRLGQLAGTVAAGWTAEFHGAGAAYLVLAAAHAAAAVAVYGLRRAGAAAEIDRAPWWEALGDFARELKHNRNLATLVMVTASVELFGFSVTTALPEFAAERLEIGAAGLGLLHAARAVGGLTAGVLLAGAVRLERRGRLFVIVIFAFGFSLILLALITHFVLALMALALVAGLAASSDILTQSMMQLSVPNRLRGRAMGAWVIAVGVSPAGHMFMGALLAAFGLSAALAINGGALLVVGALGLVVAPRLRRL